MLRLEKLQIRLDGFRLNADLTVPKGQVVAVIGPSGSGKSTLLSCIAGFLPPSSGRILWKGTDLIPLPPADRPLAMIFQDNNLFPHMTAFQNAALGLRPSLRLSAAEEKKVTATLARVGLDGLQGRRPAGLSGGQQARVSLARIRLQARPLILLDEPFAALGPALKRDMLAMVRALVDETGATALMVTHLPEDAQLVADQVILVADGIAAPPVATAALFANPPAALSDYLG